MEHRGEKMVTKEEVKNAMEYKWRGSQVKFYLMLWAVLLVVWSTVVLFSMVTNGSDWDTQSLEILGITMAVFAGVYSLVFLPSCLYSAYKQWEMLHACGRYQRYRVRLDTPETAWLYNRSVAYRVRFKTEEGDTVTGTTKPLFSSSPFAKYDLNDYNNKEVEIFYDPRQNDVILVGNEE